MNEARKAVEVQEKRRIRTSLTKNKARNNKVHTSKGLKDRRIRLSAEIAIQFYDVQDRLGCDRASEAVDWLISKAKRSIDKLIDTTCFHQEFDQNLITNIGAQNNVVHQQKSYYLTENNNNMSDILFSKNSTSSEFGFSFLQGDLPPEEKEDYRVCDDSMLFPCIQMTANSSENQPCFQQMFMFNSKMNSVKNEEHRFIPNYMPLMMSSSVHTPVIDPKLDLCLPGNRTSAFDSDQINGPFSDEVLKLCYSS